MDVLESPQLAEDYRILATPTLVKESPAPARRIIGDLRDLDAITLGLEPMGGRAKREGGAKK